MASLVPQTGIEMNWNLLWFFYRNKLKIVVLGKFILHKFDKKFSLWSQRFKYLNTSVDVAVGTFLWDKENYAVKLKIFEISIFCVEYVWFYNLGDIWITTF